MSPVLSFIFRQGLCEVSIREKTCSLVELCTHCVPIILTQLLGNSPGILISHLLTLPGTELPPFSFTMQHARTTSARVILLPRIHCCFASFTLRLFKAAVLSLLPASDWSIQLSTAADSSGVRLPYKSGRSVRQRNRAIVISPVRGVWAQGDTTRNGRSSTKKKTN